MLARAFLRNDTIVHLCGSTSGNAAKARFARLYLYIISFFHRFFKPFHIFCSDLGNIILSGKPTEHHRGNSAA